MELTEICSEKIKAMRTAYLTDEELKCRNCECPDGCDRYKPVSKTQEPVRFGINAYAIMKGGL